MCRLLLQITHTDTTILNLCSGLLRLEGGEKEGSLLFHEGQKVSLLLTSSVFTLSGSTEEAAKPWKTLAMALGCLFVSIFMIQATFCVAVRSNGALITLATLYYCCTIRTLRNGKT